MTEPVLLAQREGGITTLTLNSPQRRNALSPDLVRELTAAIEAAAHDGTRALVLRGAGPVFCSGFDFSDLDALTDDDLVERFVAIERMLQALYSAPMDTVALVQRAAVGAGADLVAACLHRVAEPGARLRFPGARFGLVLGTRRLGERVGAFAAQALVGGDGALADEALRMGLLTAVLPEAQWMGHVMQVAQHAARMPLATRAAVLTALRQGHEADAARDMAALVASASAPGLRQRIRDYLQG
jgi:enoyl-CoA hydratase/carnithine racemase